MSGATIPDKGFFVVFRLYGPKQAFYDQTWKLPDIEKGSDVRLPIWVVKFSMSALGQKRTY